MKSGKLWVAGLLALGVAAGLSAVLYWTRPDNAVRGSFTQLHSSLLRERPERAARLVAAEVTVDGRTLAGRDFLGSYKPPAESGLIEIASCTAEPSHWTVSLRDRRYCYLKEGRSWKLHWLGPAPCACRPGGDRR